MAPSGAAVESSPLPNAPGTRHERPAESYARSEHIGALSTIGVAAKVGLAGIGIDVATPLGKRLNARVGASFFSYSGSYNVDGVTINGEAKLRAVNLDLDWFPFNNAFRISPGVNVYNGNNLNASAFVAADGQFELGEQVYYSSPTDPIHGTASATFGHRVAPSITIGFGNIIPRDGHHVSFPFEIGVQFEVTAPMVNLYLSGSACISDPKSAAFDPTTCGPVDQTNLKQEESNVNADIKFLRYYPIISQGIAVRF